MAEQERSTISTVCSCCCCFWCWHFWCPKSCCHCTLLCWCHCTSLGKKPKRNFFVLSCRDNFNPLYSLKIQNHWSRLRLFCRPYNSLKTITPKAWKGLIQYPGMGSQISLKALILQWKNNCFSIKKLLNVLPHLVKILSLLCCTPGFLTY